MVKRPWVLSECNLSDFKDRRPQLAVLPWGALEAHGLHLPYGTDNYEVQILAERACGIAHRAGADVVCLPVIPIGNQANTLGYAMTLNMHASTQFAVLRDIVDSLRTHGVPKLLVVNGHGGNEFRSPLRELFGRGVFVATCNWWDFCGPDARKIFTEVGDHADEVETSLMMHLWPEIVATPAADAGSVRKPRLACIEKGWIWFARPWDRLTRDSGVGNPAAAAPEKGKAFLDLAVERLGEVIRELALAEVDEWFPYQA